MSNLAVLPDLVEQIIDRGSIGAEDVIGLRREVFGDDIVDRSEAEALFRLDQECKTKDPAWTEFYVDALTDYFVWKTEPSKYVSEENAQFLIEHIMKDGRVDGITELELLINIAHWAQSCPEQLVLFVLEAVRDSVLNPGTAAYGCGRRPGVIDAVDVAIIQRVIYGGGGEGGFTVSRQEAELLFELNNATVEAENAETWRDLFVKAVANYVMFPRGAPVVPDARKALRREAWLADRRGVGGLLVAMGRSIGDTGIGETLAEVDLFGTRRRNRIASVVNRARVASARESIDEAEAAWLIDRISEDDVLHDNERALLAFIKETSPQIHPSLETLLTKAGL